MNLPCIIVERLLPEQFVLCTIDVQSSRYLRRQIVLFPMLVDEDTFVVIPIGRYLVVTFSLLRVIEGEFI